jgi:hypothetical protein
MSTERQQYLRVNQLEFIRQYAGGHNMEIVQDHSDMARTGLNINGWDSLDQLMADVEAQACCEKMLMRQKALAPEVGSIKSHFRTEGLWRLPPSPTATPGGIRYAKRLYSIICSVLAL